MRAFVSCLLALGTLPGLAAAQTPPAEPPVVVVPLPGPDLTVPAVTAVRDAVVEQVSAMVEGRPTVALEDEQRLVALLECADPACVGAQLAQVGAIAGVLLRLERPRPADPVTVTLTAVDPVSGTPRMDPVQVQLDDEQLEAPAEVLRPAVTQLAPAMPPAPPRSSLLVAVNVDDALVRIDDRELGRTPVAPVELPPGRHVVEVSAPGFGSARQSIDVGRGEDARIDVVLEAAATNVALLEADQAPLSAEGGGGAAAGPWYTRWYVIAGGGVALAALIVGIVAIASSGGDESQSSIPVPPIE